MSNSTRHVRGRSGPRLASRKRRPNAVWMYFALSVVKTMSATFNSLATGIEWRNADRGQPFNVHLQSARGLAHSTTLRAGRKSQVIAPRLGLRRPSAAFLPVCTFPSSQGRLPHLSIEFSFDPACFRSEERRVG